MLCLAEPLRKEHCKDSFLAKALGCGDGDWSSRLLEATAPLKPNSATHRPAERKPSVSKRLNVRDSGVWTTHIAGPVARIQSDVREHHVGGVGEVESV